jgi:phosphodiesterase/alkaline phosphatase D-like protein
MRSYRKYQRGHPEQPPEPASFGFKFDGYPFFMLDTRSERTLRQTGGLATATLFSNAGSGNAFDALKQWFADAPTTGPKFVITPAMFLPRHRRTVQNAPPGKSLESTNLSAFHSDGWDGYPETLRLVLGLIAETPIQHVVFLSGDEHRSCIAQIELRLKGGGLITRVHSIHTSAAYAPFPFANSFAEDFMTSETIEFTHNSKVYDCVVPADARPPHDGATLLRPWKEAGAWRLACECSDGSVRTLLL